MLDANGYPDLVWRQMILDRISRGAILALFAYVAGCIALLAFSPPFRIWALDHNVILPVGMLGISLAATLDAEARLYVRTDRRPVLFRRLVHWAMPAVMLVFLVVVWDAPQVDPLTWTWLAIFAGWGLQWLFDEIADRRHEPQRLRTSPAERRKKIALAHKRKPMAGNWFRPSAPA